MESSDSIDKSWDTSSDMTTTAHRSDPQASVEPPASVPHGWMVNVAGRDVVELPHAEVIAKWRSGEISSKALVWREGMESWAVLDSVPAFQIVSRPPPPVVTTRAKLVPAKVLAKEEASATDEGRPVAVYERPIATLVFDEAVEDEWKAPLKAREPSKATRGSVSSRPPAPSLPPLAPPVVRSSPSVPFDQPPPPPPLPPRRASASPAARPASPAARVSTIIDAPRATIPGGLAAPTPPAPSTAPLKPSASTAPAKTSTSPLLSAIAAAASNPAPPIVEAVVPAPPLPPPVPAALELPVAATRDFDEVSFSARLFARKTISVRTASLACAGSALVASLVTGLIVGSRAPQAEAPPPAAPRATVAAAKAAPEPPPPAAPATPPPEPVATSQSEPSETKAAEKPGELKVAEKAKAPAPTKVRAWKPPPSSDAPAGDSAANAKQASNPLRDDPESAVPDIGADRSDKPANWNADPGF